MTPNEFCLLLDHAARHDLRTACKRGYINRSQHKQRGIRLLVGLGLMENTRTLKTMYRYEPTALGREVSQCLPNEKAEWEHIMHKKALVYADGSTVAYGETPRYSYVRDYDKRIQELKQENKL